MKTRVDYIDLHSAPLAKVGRADVFFAFSNGRLSYDCVGCGAQCCRGHGYTLNPGIALQQLTHNPNLRFFLEKVTNAPTVRNCPPNCFFLTEHGLCDIQVKSGYSAKPETCRLFPFNNLRLVDEFLVVAPHALCPLQIEEPGKTSECSDYEHILDEMTRQGIQNPIPSAKPIVASAGELIDLERAIVSSSENHLVDPFPVAAATQCDLTLDATRVNGVANGTGSSQERGAVVVTEFLNQARLVLGVEANEMSDDPVVDRVLGAITPFLRSQLVFRSPGEHVRCLAEIDLARVPKMIIGTYLVAHLARQAGMPKITPQTVSRLFSDFHTMLVLLAFLDTPMVWHTGADLNLPVPDDNRFQKAYLRVAAALVPEQQKRNRRQLVEVLLEHNQWNGVDRVQFLKLVANRLHGRIRPINRVEGFKVRLRQRVSSGVQQFVVKTLDPDILAHAIARRAKKIAVAHDSTPSPQHN